MSNFFSFCQVFRKLHKHLQNIDTPWNIFWHWYTYNIDTNFFRLPQAHPLGDSGLGTAKRQLDSANQRWTNGAGNWGIPQHLGSGVASAVDWSGRSPRLAVDSRRDIHFMLGVQSAPLGLTPYLGLWPNLGNLVSIKGQALSLARYPTAPVDSGQKAETELMTSPLISWWRVLC